MLRDCRLFLVKERVALMKLVDTFDIYDAQSSAQIGVAKEEPPTWVRYLRLLVNKSLLPTVVNVYEQPTDHLVLSMSRPFTFLRANVTVADGQGIKLGLLRSKILSLGGGFFVHDPSGQQVAEVKGDWKGWNFTVRDNHGLELGQVTKKWAGIGKELFTSADNYMISVNEQAFALPDPSLLLLAAGLAIDIVFKERK